MSEIAIIDLTDNTVVRIVSRSLKRVELPNGAIVMGTKPGWTGGGDLIRKDDGTATTGAAKYRFIEVVRENASPPDRFHHEGKETRSLTDDRLTIAKTWVPFTDAEKAAALDKEVEVELDGLLRGKLGKIILALARGPHRPDLTPAQLRAYIKGL